MFHPHNALLINQVTELGVQLSLGRMDWFANRGIEVFDKTKYWLLRKAIGSDNNHWNIICNGVIFTKTGHLISFPLIKLRNHTDTLVNYTNSDLVEKIKGKRYCICFPNHSIAVPLYHTDTEVSNFFCDKEFNDVKYILSQVELSCFEHNTSQTITLQYDGKELYLISCTLLRNLYEYEEAELDSFAEQMKVARPFRIKCNSYMSMRDILQNKSEQFILRDRTTGERANVNILLKKPKLLSTLRYKYLVPYWLSGETRNVTNEYPEAIYKFEEIEKAAVHTAKCVKSSALKWQQLNLSQRGLVESISMSSEPKWSVKIIMDLQKLPHEEWYNFTYKQLKKMQSKTLIKILNLIDEEVIKDQ